MSGSHGSCGPNEGATSPDRREKSAQPHPLNAEGSQPCCLPRRPRATRTMPPPSSPIRRVQDGQGALQVETPAPVDPDQNLGELRLAEARRGFCGPLKCAATPLAPATRSHAPRLRAFALVYSHIDFSDQYTTCRGNASVTKDRLPPFCERLASPPSSGAPRAPAGSRPAACAAPTSYRESVALPAKERAHGFPGPHPSGRPVQS